MNSSSKYRFVSLLGHMFRKVSGPFDQEVLCAANGAFAIRTTISTFGLWDRLTWLVTRKVLGRWKKLGSKVKRGSSPMANSQGETQTNIGIQNFKSRAAKSQNNFSFQSVLPAGYERVTLRPFREKKKRVD